MVLAGVVFVVRDSLVRRTLGCVGIFLLVIRNHKLRCTGTDWLFHLQKCSSLATTRRSKGNVPIINGLDAETTILDECNNVTIISC